ncbi:hypothetical protein Trydic_g366 [Trypoxylus dichotomus]
MKTGSEDLQEFDVDDEDPLAQRILKHKDSEAVDEKGTISLHDWAIINDLMKGPLNAVDDCLLPYGYPTEIEIAAAVTKIQFNEKSESEEEEEAHESIFETFYDF